MVNNLTRQQKTPDVGFHNKAVLAHVAKPRSVWVSRSVLVDVPADIDKPAAPLWISGA